MQNPSVSNEGIAPNAKRLLWAGFLAILAAGIALQQAGVIKPDVDVKKVLDDLIDDQYLTVTTN